MKKLSLIATLVLLIITGTYAQDKKVAVITFYADKRIGMEEIGLELTANLLKLEEDPNFNLTPMLQKFHTEFFDNYSKSFPFKLAPENDVLNSEAYKAFVPKDRPDGYKNIKYNTIDGYKIIVHQWSTTNDKSLADIFKEYDGIMYVSIHFSFVKAFAIGGMGAAKINARANMKLVDKNGNKVFDINENATSKKTSPLVSGLPVMNPDKILPMCESALNELMADLGKRIPKIIKKTEAKL